MKTGSVHRDAPEPLVLRRGVDDVADYLTRADQSRFAAREWQAIASRRDEDSPDREYLLALAETQALLETAYRSAAAKLVVLVMRAKGDRAGAGVEEKLRAQSARDDACSDLACKGGCDKRTTDGQGTR